MLRVLDLYRAPLTAAAVDKLFKTKADVGDVSVKAEQKAVDGVFNNVKNLENFMKQVSERAVEVLARRGELSFCASERAGTARRARGPQHAAPRHPDNLPFASSNTPPFSSRTR